MTLEGPSIKHQSQLTNAADKTAAHSISQLMIFNSVKNAQSINSPANANRRHMYEIPLPLYTATKIHSLTRIAEI